MNDETLKNLLEDKELPFGLDPSQIQPNSLQV